MRGSNEREWVDMEAIAPPHSKLHLRPAPARLPEFAGYTGTTRLWNGLLNMQWTTRATLITGSPIDLMRHSNAGQRTWGEFARLRRALLTPPSELKPPIQVEVTPEFLAEAKRLQEEYEKRYWLVGAAAHARHGRLPPEKVANQLASEGDTNHA